MYQNDGRKDTVAVVTRNIMNTDKRLAWVIPLLVKAL